MARVSKQCPLCFVVYWADEGHNCIIEPHTNLAAYDIFEVTYNIGFFYIDRFGGKIGPFKSLEEAQASAQKARSAA